MMGVLKNDPKPVGSHSTDSAVDKITKGTLVQFQSRLFALCLIVTHDYFLTCTRSLILKSNVSDNI